MASEKKPSIYYDRGTIGSSAELDEYGVWVKSEPQDLSFAGAEGQEFAESSPPSSGSAGDDFDPVSGADDLSSLPDLDIPDEDSLSGLDDLGLPEPDNGEDFSGAVEAAGLEEQETGDSGEEGFTEISMDDFLEPAESELAEPVPVKEKKQDGDLSTQLLMKIADELASIRTELTTLKKEFAVVKGEPSAEEHGDSQNRGGFFDEEDDEKIALTGDELDNILNTADFTEETGADATGELKDDAFAETDDLGSFGTMDETPLPDMLSDQEDIIGSGEGEKEIEEDGGSVPDDGDAGGFSFGEPELDELGSGTKVEDQIPDFSLDELDNGNDGLEQLREDGAVPMTLPPEDTTYLEEDPLAAEKIETGNEDSAEISLEDSAGDFALDDLSLDESALDLSEAVIDEPDLSAGITENPLMEPSLDDFSLDDDISLDLDLSEPEEKTAGDGENADEGAAEDTPEDISIELDDDTAFDISAEEGDVQSGEDISVPEVPFPDINAEDITEEVAFEDTPELPSVKSAEDDSFAPVIPEGFIVEADDSQVPFEDDIEEKEVLADGGITALDETAETPPEEEAVTAELPRETEDSGAAEEGDDDETMDIPSNIKQELKTVLSYMDQLLESLPDEKIEEFARSEYFDTYKKLFKELGLV
ncbi:MAG: hypothetical protein LBL44_05480 [Treponema sp.]|jgi:hypothetical protein|nr:hypothetical protein [Treponema sp.]